VDQRVRRHYEVVNEDDRLWKPGTGDLVRLRTWDLFDRLVPASCRIADVGGGPGTHAAYLAGRGHEVTLIDPMSRHVAAAAARSAAQPASPFRAIQGDARALPLPDASVDVALLMGPLYHLVEQTDRRTALREAIRVLRPGGILIAEIITRCAWLMEATLYRLLDDEQTWDDIGWNLRTGLTKDPTKWADGSFWAYLHRPEDLAVELESVGLQDIELRAVEGFARFLDDLPGRMADPAGLLRAVRLTESEPSILGVSPHVIGSARRP
jgi:ubiquinone/menaquinone biosynthesis C-methylase UbiE